jgi:hypothetical protein
MRPAHVAARLFEFGVLKRLHPLFSIRLTFLTHPLGAAFLGMRRAGRLDLRIATRGRERVVDDLARDPAIGIVRPCLLWAPHRHHLASARVTTAVAPLLFGLLMDALGTRALVVSAGLSLAALGALVLLRAQPVSARA